jgi:hypothetical protein
MTAKCRFSVPLGVGSVCILGMSEFTGCGENVRGVRQVGVIPAK